MLVRAAAQPADTRLPAWPHLTGDPTDLELCRDWLKQVWSHESFVAAVTVASPVLAAQVERACDGPMSDPRRMRRLVFSVARYLLRATGRSTPFGLFAGAAAASFGTRPRARWGDRHRALVRADAAWLAPLIGALEACLPLLRRLPVVANNLATVRGDRLILPFREPPGGDRAGQAALTDVSVRYTRAVEAALRYASSPIELSELIRTLAADFPRTSPNVVEAMLADLVQQGVLLTGLRPPMTATDGLSHAVRLLRAVNADAIAEIADLVRALYAVADELTAHNRTGSGPRSDRWMSLAERMRLVNHIEQPIMVDLHLDLDVTLPARVAQEVQAAAAALTRLTPYPFGMPPWQEFHAAFLERYGPGAVIPLLEVINPNAGLGFPATFRGSERTVTASPVSQRDRRLAALAQTATIAGRDEIVLDEQLIADLASEATGRQQVPPHIELFVQIHADSGPALQQGRFTLIVTGAARAAGATTGRFLDLLDEPSRRRFRDTYAGVPTLRTGAVPAQVTGPPLRAKSQNVAYAPATLARAIPVGENPCTGTLPLTELAVGGDADGLCLVWLTERALIEPTALNAVEFRHFSQPLARFLCELSRARAAVYMPFSWGEASSLPFLPRVRYGRTVLSAARWNLAAADLPPRQTPWPAWRRALADWRRRLRVPGHVYLVEGDNLLPLDLDEDLHLMLLRSHLDRHDGARLDEAPPTSAYGWLDGHTHEIAVPLATTVDPLPAPAHIPDEPDQREAHLPGASPWLYAKLYAPTSRHTDLLTNLAAFLSESDSPAEWWYLPYLDPQPHLRVRLRLAGSDDYGPAARRLGEWAARLHQGGLLAGVQLDTYHPETGRYGHGEAMAAAEQVFGADSTAALAQRQTAYHGGTAGEAIATASLVDLTIGYLDGIDTGMRWLVDQLPHEPAPVDRTLHAATMRLAVPGHDWAALRTTPGGTTIVAAWRHRREALADYRRRLAAQRDPLPVLGSLLHMHHVRMFGIDPDRERILGRLARAAAKRWFATNPQAAP